MEDKKRYKIYTYGILTEDNATIEDIKGVLSLYANTDELGEIFSDAISQQNDSEIHNILTAEENLSQCETIENIESWLEEVEENTVTGYPYPADVKIEEIKDK